MNSARPFATGIEAGGPNLELWKQTIVAVRPKAMPLRNARFILIVFALSSLAVANSQTTSGKVAQIPKTFKTKLKASKLRVVVPTWIPKGFKLVKSNVVHAKEMFMRDVYLRYEKPGTKSSFFVQFASDGIGDPFFDLPNGDTLEATGIVKGKNPIIGPFDMEYVTKKPYLMWHITWYELKQKGYPKYVLVAGENIPISDGKKIIESLSWLR